MPKIPAHMIGEIGELHAYEWLKNDGFDTISYADLTHSLIEPKLEQLSIQTNDPMLQRRESKIQSLSARINNLRLKIMTLENSPEIDDYKKWFKEQKKEQNKLEKELEDILAGKPFKTLEEEF
tara:strand:- start:45 stop:413 length:369 start_codon:yes stop_codon:yes gene_type:complete